MSAVPRPPTGAPATRRLRTLLLVPLAALAACLDFVAPEFPDAGQPVVFNGALRVLDNETLSVEGSMIPGREPTGFRRVVLRPEVLVLDTAIAPSGDAEVFSYFGTVPVTPDQADGPVTWTAPEVDGVAPPPSLVWYPWRPVLPDTFSAVAGSDLVVRLEPPAGTTEPAVERMQWFVTIVGAGGSVRVSADGAPPQVIRIPPSFLPEPQGDRWRVRVQVFENVSMRPAPGDYIAQLSLETRFDWIVTRLPPP